MSTSRTEATRRDDLGDVREGRQVRADLGVGGHVHGAGGVVKDQHARALEKRAGNAEALLLAAGDVDAALAQVPAEPPMRSRNSSTQATRQASRSLVVGGVRRAPLAGRARCR